jgi:hypothetical protein
MKTPISEAAKVAGAKNIWIPPAQKPQGDQAACSVLLMWFDVPEVFEVTAFWHEDDPRGSGCDYFEYGLFDDEHNDACAPGDKGVRIIGWRYL